MIKNLFLILLVGVVVGTSGGAFGFTAWGNYTLDGKWETAANWSGGAPGIGNDTWIYVASNGFATMSGTTNVPIPFTPVFAMPIISAQSPARSHIEKDKSIFC